MWTPSLLVRWLTSLNVPANDEYGRQLVPLAGPFIPPQPNRVVVATLGPGAGTLREDLFDQPAFQLFVRGDQNDLSGDTAAVVASAYDKAVLFDGDAANRTVLDDDGSYLGRLVAVQRAGGAPAPIGPPTADNGWRVEMTCSYVLQVSTF